MAGQRRRFASTVAGLSAQELTVPSRCAGWTVADVLRHLVWADDTLRALWSGDESMLAGFDPRTTPADAVRADRAVPDDEIRQRYLVSAEAMALDLEAAGPERFGLPSISPVGPVPWWMSAVHLSWDSTVHERDVLAPLGRAVEDVPAEIEPCLAYSLVLVSFFCGRAPVHVRIGSVHLRRGADGVVQAWDDTAADGGGRDDQPGLDDTTVLTGPPVAAIDALCGRGSLTTTLAGDGGVIERLGGLARYFTSAP
jgi:uncharacterized protein (TIGR03083 family)